MSKLDGKNHLCYLDTIQLHMCHGLLADNILLPQIMKTQSNPESRRQIYVNYLAYLLALASKITSKFTCQLSNLQ